MAWRLHLGIQNWIANLEPLPVEQEVHGLPVVEGLVAVRDGGPDGGREAHREEELQRQLHRGAPRLRRGRLRPDQRCKIVKKIR